MIYGVFMTTIAFDTFKFIKTLEDAGVPRKQGGALVSAQQREAFSEAIAPHKEVATKEEVVIFKSELKEDLKEFATKNDLLTTKKDLEIALEATKVDILKWMFAGFFTLAAMIISLFIKLM